MFVPSPRTRTGWQYRSVDLNTYNNTGQWERLLNEEGLNKWELVSVVQVNSHTLRAVFKKEKMWEATS